MLIMFAYYDFPILVSATPRLLQLRFPGARGVQVAQHAGVPRHESWGSQPMNERTNASLVRDDYQNGAAAWTRRGTIEIASTMLASQEEP